MCERRGWFLSIYNLRRTELGSNVDPVADSCHRESNGIIQGNWCVVWNNLSTMAEADNGTVLLPEGDPIYCPIASVTSSTIIGVLFGIALVIGPRTTLV